MATRTPIAQITKQSEKKEFFSSTYSLGKKANLKEIGTTAYLIFLGLEGGLYETAKHTVYPKKNGNTSEGFQGSKYGKDIICKGHDDCGNKVEDALCCKYAQEMYDANKADPTKTRLISFTSYKVDIPCLLLGTSETDETAVSTPPSKVSIKTYDFCYMSMAKNTFNKDIYTALEQKLKDDGVIDYDLEGDELAEELLTQLQNSVVKVTSVKSDKGLIAYEKTISIIPFSNPNLGKASNEHEAIVNFRKNQKVMNDISDFMTLFDTEVQKLSADWTEAELQTYMEDAEKVEARDKCVEQAKTKEEEQLKKATPADDVEPISVDEFDDIDDSFDIDEEEFLDD